MTEGDSSPTIIRIPPGAPPSGVKACIKSFARFLSSLVILPFWLIYRMAAIVLGKDRALEDASQWLSLLPGLLGQYLRRAFLQRVLAHCHPTAVVEFGTLFSQTGAQLDENVYVGPRCSLGLVHLEKDVLLAGNVQIPSGGMTHYFDDPDKPIREQGGERRLVRIGAGAWIGTSAVVLADVGAGTVVAAGSVVTKPLPPNVIAAGVPARVVRQRLPQPASKTPKLPPAPTQEATAFRSQTPVPPEAG